MTTNEDFLHAMLGCDGENCDDPEEKVAYPVADLPGIAFCAECMSAHVRSNKKKRFCSETVEKIRRKRPSREEMWA